MINLLLRDKKRRSIVSKYEYKKLSCKKIITNSEIPLNIRQEIYFKFSNLPKNSSSTRIKNRCIFTNRARAVLRNFQVSRLVLRQLGSSGEISGLIKSSW